MKPKLSLYFVHTQTQLLYYKDITIAQEQNKKIIFYIVLNKVLILNTFYNKIIKISKDINCDPNDLMGIINLETSGTFNPSIKNGIGATGLIQFLPDVTKEDIKKGVKKDLVKRVGKRISELEKMSAEEQLDYVEKYFKSHIKEKKIKGRIDGATLYSIVFWPKAANKNDDYVIAKQGSNVYAQNPLLDKDKSDKAITKKDLGERLKDFIA